MHEKPKQDIVRIFYAARCLLFFDLTKCCCSHCCWFCHCRQRLHFSWSCCCCWWRSCSSSWTSNPGHKINLVWYEEARAWWEAAQSSFFRLLFLSLTQLPFLSRLTEVASDGKVTPTLICPEETSSKEKQNIKKGFCLRCLDVPTIFFTVAQKNKKFFFSYHHLLWFFLFGLVSQVGRKRSMFDCFRFLWFSGDKTALFMRRIF